MRVPFVVVLLLSAVLAGCGGSSSPKTTSSAPAAASGLTKAQYIAKVNPICASARKRAPVARILTLIGQFPTPTAEIASLLRKTAQIVKQVRDQLSAIPPPPADQAAIKLWIAQDAAIGGLVSKAADQVARGDLVAAVKSEGDINAAGVDPLTFAKDYGLGDCSSFTG